MDAPWEQGADAPCSDAQVTQLPSSSLDNEKRQALSEYEAACFIKNEIEKYLKENKDLKM